MSDRSKFGDANDRALAAAIATADTLPNIHSERTHSPLRRPLDFYSIILFRSSAHAEWVLCVWKTIGLELMAERANVCMFNGNVWHEVGLELMKRDKHSRNAEWISLLIQFFFFAFFLCSSATRRNRNGSKRCVRSIHFVLILIRQLEWHCCSRQVRPLVAAAAAARSQKRTYTRRVNIDTCRSTLNNMFSFLFASRLCSHVGVCGLCHVFRRITHSHGGSMARNKRHFRPERVVRVPYESPRIGTKFAMRRKSISNVISHMSSIANAAREMNNKWK